MMDYSEMQYGSQQLASPGLAVQILRASQDIVITPQEFSEIVGTITNIAVGIATTGIIGMLFGTLTKALTTRG